MSNTWGGAQLSLNRKFSATHEPMTLAYCTERQRKVVGWMTFDHPSRHDARGTPLKKCIFLSRLSFIVLSSPEGAGS